MLAPGAPVLRRMGSPDLGTSLEATRELLALCTVQPLPNEEFALMMGYNAMMPQTMRAALGGRPADYYAVLRTLSVPVLTAHGDADLINLPAMNRHTNTVTRNCTALVYPDVGHMPFWEDALRFDADLANFLRALP